MVGAREASVTVWTLERFDSSVFSEMSRQFIRPSELPRAAFPGAFVGLFSCKKERRNLIVFVVGNKKRSYDF